MGLFSAMVLEGELCDYCERPAVSVLLRGGWRTLHCAEHHYRGEDERGEQVRQRVPNEQAVRLVLSKALGYLDAATTMLSEMKAPQHHLTALAVANGAMQSARQWASEQESPNER